MTYWFVSPVRVYGWFYVGSTQEPHEGGVLTGRPVRRASGAHAAARSADPVGKRALCRRQADEQAGPAHRRERRRWR